MFERAIFVDVKDIRHDGDYVICRMSNSVYNI